MTTREKEANKDYMLRYNFGIGAAEYNALLETQKHGCAICGRLSGTEVYAAGKTKQLAVDHCEKSGAIRGLLCGDCNRAIGQLQHSPGLLRKAADYLEAALDKVRQAEEQADAMLCSLLNQTQENS